MSANRWSCQQNVSCLDHGIMFHKSFATKKNCTSLSSLTDLLRQVHKTHQIGERYSALKKILNIGKKRNIYLKVREGTKKRMMGWLTNIFDSIGIN